MYFQISTKFNKVIFKSGFVTISLKTFSYKFRTFCNFLIIIDHVFGLVRFFFSVNLVIISYCLTLLWEFFNSINFQKCPIFEMVKICE